MKTICPKCGIEFENNTNRKFCSRKCANSHNISQETKKKISNYMKNKWKTKEYQKQMQTYQINCGQISHNKKLNRYVKAKNGQILDITYKELEEYQKTHLVCEICGKAERASHNKKEISKLCRDHDHQTSKFRGLLCSNCNRKLGWFETYKKEINNYLNKSTSS